MQQHGFSWLLVLGVFPREFSPERQERNDSDHSESVKLTDSNTPTLYLLTATDHLRVNMLISPTLHFGQMSGEDEKSSVFVHYNVNEFDLTQSNYFK